MASSLLVAVIVVAATFVLSGAVPAYVRSTARIKRTAAFTARYRAWAAEDEPDGQGRDWLIARGAEMQEDAAAAGQGVLYVAPPLAAGGGGYRPHYMFSDLAGAQTFGAGRQERLDALTQTQHRLESIARQRRWDLIRPWRWVQLAFERLVRFPRYVLKAAGFSDAIAGSSVTKGAGVLWGLLVGAAGIGSFVLALTERT